MKTSYLFSFLFLLFSNALVAQQNTTVIAHSIDISDNFDLRAVATLFGESLNLEDFESRLNDPEIKISNLDLNQDNHVDYLRVFEILKNSQHFIVIQAVLGQDLFQDIATIEVEKETQSQRVQIQVVGNEYFYGTYYVYEPVFVSRPLIFNYFWQPYYVAYYSPWYWGYYPTYYHVWNPYPIHAYRNHIGLYINVNNFCHYRPHDRSQYFYSNHLRSNRYDAYERQNPNRSFSNRNQGYTNRNELSVCRNTNGRNTNSTKLQVNNRSVRETRNQSNSTQRVENSRRNNTSNNATNGLRNTSIINTSNVRSNIMNSRRLTTASTRPYLASASRSGREYSSQSFDSPNGSKGKQQFTPIRHSGTSRLSRSSNLSVGGKG